MQPFYRCWVEIDLDALRENYREIRRHTGDAKLIAVVKADAYGHGARVVAGRLQEWGADGFAVAQLQEALELRSYGIERPILILGATPPEYAGELARYGLHQTVYSKEYGLSLGRAAQEAGVRVCCHLKLDVGMSRLGFSTGEAALSDAREVFANPALERSGVFMHFPCADFDGDADGSLTLEQFGAFVSAVEALEKQGIAFALHHASNSAAILSKEYARLDAVRAGIILYGMPPSGALADAMEYHPAMRLCAKVTQVKTVEAGAAISYGGTFRAPRQMQVATVAAGYADGYYRALSDKGEVTVRGHRARVLGRVCMDQMMVDVTGLDCTAGDTAVLFGPGGVSCEEYAATAGTINYEAICSVHRRVPHLYLEQGTVIETENYMRSPE